jgi:DNA polymerase V
MILFFALVDCNNFFVSCERAFRPDLEHKPVMVLSNNDGCVISRSQEVKDMDIPMGAPYFKIKDWARKYNVHVFSSNFALYGDLSHRVMTTLEQFTDEIEFYSIDEAFLQFPASPTLIAYAAEIRRTVRQWTRIPVSIGIASTKTLAKIANHIAKKNPVHNGVFKLKNEEVDTYLAKLPASEVWGIGRQQTLFLRENGIRTALELKNAPDQWVKKNLSVTGFKIVSELRGISCLPLETAPTPKKGIISSRSFGRAITNLNELEEAVALYTTRAAEKLREEHRAATAMYVMIRTNYHNQDKKYSKSLMRSLPLASAHTPYLISQALEILREIYKEGFKYWKAGVGFVGLVPDTEQQQNLFIKTDHHKNNRLMKAVDQLNNRFGDNTVTFAATGKKRGWKMKSGFRSPRYTTVVGEVPRVK